MTSSIINTATTAGPGMHALIVGVSEYLHLPEANEPPDPETWNFRKLASPALSAFRIKERLTQISDSLSLPLKTCRLLLSPSDAEKAAEPKLQQLAVSPASRDEFQKAANAWREDARHDQRNITLFYFSGHGLQRGPEESILTFEDFADPTWPLLTKCARFSSLRNGMAPSSAFEDIARTQFYFIDACRNVLEGLAQFAEMAVPDVFAVTLNTVDRRQAPAFFATVDGAVAGARSGKPSVFCEALLSALERGADQPEDLPAGGTVWPVTALSIKHAIDRFIVRRQIGQDVVLTSIVGDPILRNLPEAPTVELGVEVLPPSLAGNASLALCEIVDDSPIDRFAEDPWKTSPLEVSVPAGQYRLRLGSATLANNPYRSKLVFVTQRFKSPWRHDLTGSLTPAHP